MVLVYNTFGQFTSTVSTINRICADGARELSKSLVCEHLMLMKYDDFIKYEESIKLK